MVTHFEHGSSGIPSDPQFHVCQQLRRDEGKGLCPLQTEGHLGSAGTCPGKGADFAPLQWSKKELFGSYSEKEELTFQEGCMSLE